MSEGKQFTVFGEPVLVAIGTEETGGVCAAIVQTSPPGGGPPPHLHQNEDEVFTVLEGEFEIFDGSGWNPLNAGETVFAPRGKVHAFRNRGTREGRIQAVTVPGNRFEHYLEEISVLEMPRDMEKLVEISARFGIEFVTPDAPEEAPL